MRLQLHQSCKDKSGYFGAVGLAILEQEVRETCPDGGGRQSYQAEFTQERDYFYQIGSEYVYCPRRVDGE